MDIVFKTLCMVLIEAALIGTITYGYWLYNFRVLEKWKKKSNVSKTDYDIQLRWLKHSVWHGAMTGAVVTIASGLAYAFALSVLL